MTSWPLSNSGFYRSQALFYRKLSDAYAKQDRKFTASLAQSISGDLHQLADKIEALEQANDLCATQTPTGT
jgi:hypothetical protein